ncbi:MAG: hypothetical protein JKY25_12800 [Robiginitomaculum sp.]|nr:hypothetical protein [Robiginitomaculum sp.]
MAQETKKKTTKATKYTFKTPAAVQKGFRAYVGMFGAAYERAVPVFDKAAKNYDDYAARGEKLETSATSFVKDARKNVTEFASKRYEMRAAKVRSFFPKAANDRVVELEAEIAKLNKKIVTLAKKAPKKTAKRVTKVAKKAVETVKAA